MKNIILFFITLIFVSCNSSIGTGGQNLITNNPSDNSANEEIQADDGVVIDPSSNDIEVLLNTSANFASLSFSNLSNSSNTLSLESQKIFETGRIDISGTIDSGIFETIKFENTYVDPIVIVQVLTSNNSDTVSARVRNLSGNNCDLFLQKSDASAHGSSETVSYIVVESGEYSLANGMEIRAFHHNTDTEHSESSSFAPDSVSFTSVGSTPLAFSSLNTFNNNDFKSSVILGVSSNSVDVLQESLGSGTTTSFEDVAVLVITSFSGDIQGHQVTTDTATSSRAGVDNNTPAVASFSFSTLPNVFSDGATDNGSDGYFVRGSGNWSTVSYGVYAWEDTGTDGERAHTTESFSFLAIDNNSELEIYETSAQFETSEYNLSHLGIYNSSQVSWSESLGSGVSLSVEYSISNNEGVSFGSWNTVTNGGELTLLSGVSDFSNTLIKFRGTFSSSNNLEAGSLSSFSFSIETN